MESLTPCWKLCNEELLLRRLQRFYSKKSCYSKLKPNKSNSEAICSWAAWHLIPLILKNVHLRAMFYISVLLSASCSSEKDVLDLAIVGTVLSWASTAFLYNMLISGIYILFLLSPFSLQYWQVTMNDYSSLTGCVWTEL